MLNVLFTLKAQILFEGPKDTRYSSDIEEAGPKLTRKKAERDISSRVSEDGEKPKLERSSKYITFEDVEEFRKEIEERAKEDVVGTNIQTGINKEDIKYEVLIRENSNKLKDIESKELEEQKPKLESKKTQYSNLDGKNRKRRFDSISAKDLAALKKDIKSHEKESFAEREERREDKRKSDNSQDNGRGM